MKSSENKKKIVEKLANLCKQLDVQRLYNFPRQEDTQRWLADIASVLKNLDEGDYQEIVRLSKIITPTEERNHRKEAAYEIKAFATRKVAEYKRYDFSNLDKQKNGQQNNFQKSLGNMIKKYWLGLVILLLVIISLLLIGYRPEKWTVKLPFLEGEFVRQNNLSNKLQITPSPVVEIQNNITPATIFSNLRSLEPLETGKNIDKLPDNIYGFADGLLIAYDIKNQKIFSLSLRSNSYDYFEIQKTNGDNLLIGFVSEENYSKIGEINTENPITLTLFPIPWNNMNRLVAISFNSISEISYRRIDLDSDKSLSVLDLKTNRILTGNISHAQK